MKSLLFSPSQLTYALLIVAIFHFPYFSFGQQSESDQLPLNKKVKFISWVQLKSESVPVVGFIYQLKDSSIMLYKPAKDSEDGELQEIKIADIDVIRIRNKKWAIHGGLVGIFAGFGIGTLTGWNNYEPDPDCWVLCPTRLETGLVTGMAGAVAGALTGAIINFRKKKVKLYGRQDHYESNKRKLYRFSMIR